MNAGKEDYFIVGTLQADEGDQIEISSSLTKGSVKVELMKAPEGQSIDQIPELNGEPVLTADVSGTDSTSGTVSAGAYLLKATCMEKAAGTVQVEAKPAE